MKKSLIALAIASAVSAPAFAATSNVDIYGKINVSVNWYDDQCASAFDCSAVAGSSTTTGGINDISFTSNSSRIGFKGAEDLGGGLSAIWQIESGINTDEGNGNWASRNTFLGLKGGWGTALIGNHDTPLKLVGRAVDLFGDGLADSRNVLGGGSDMRTKNTFAYISPDMSGFGIAAAYSTDPSVVGATAVPFDPTQTSLGYAISSANTSDAEDRDVWNVNATYSNGPLYLGGAWGGGNGHDALGVGDHWRLAAGYTFGNFKVVGQYDNLEDNSTTVGTQPGDFDAWMVGGSYTMGAMVFKANYMEGEYDGEVPGDGYENQQWTVGMDYNLSKRTSVYALYVDGQNIVLGGGAGLADQVIGTGVGGDSDLDVSGLSFGMVHSF